ncbi:MAG TPA: hypothetical protein VGJ55_10720 [Pyrinomonadaceae bacterium]
MKRCPNCNRTFTDDALSFCLEDGTPLLGVDAPPPAYDPGATLQYPAARDTDPPPTVAYRPETPLVNQIRPAPAWSPMPSPQPRKRSVWPWIIGGVAIVGFMGFGLLILILALANMDTNSNNQNANSNSRPANRNLSANSNANVSNENTNDETAVAPEFKDDFSTESWGTGTYSYGDISYKDEEYHMHANKGGYIVMYGPNKNYQTENATVRVTTRSVDGISPDSGYGLVVHGEKSKDKKELEDYAFLIFTGANPAYEIVQHRGGTQTTVVSWTKSSVIRSGTSTNQLEVRTQDKVLTFYINGQYMTSITDTAGFLRGLAGFYTSDANEVAFDDLEISRTGQ